MGMGTNAAPAAVEATTAMHQLARRRVMTLAVCLSFLQLLVPVDGYSQHFSPLRPQSYQRQLLAQKCKRRRRVILQMDVEHGLHERRLWQRVGLDRHAVPSMPWKESITPHQYTLPIRRRQRKRRRSANGNTSEEIEASSSSSLLYMPFWNRQLQFMQDNLTNLRQVPVEEELSYRENGDGTARIVNHCYASDEYRKIRMTYYDAGDKTQVFNSLWYPDPRYDAPVVGIDLLAFNRRPDDSGMEAGIQGKYLSVIDFQPIHEDNSKSGTDVKKFSNALGTIRNDYPSLQGKMSARFYDEKRHFSSGMVFGRCDTEDFVDEELLPAFERSMQAHLDLLRAMPPDDGNANSVLGGQAAYDSYSSVRDPAMALFTKMFGKDWANRYVFDFLFDLADASCVKREVDLIARSPSNKN